MTESRKLRSYEYVNRPYDQVCTLLRERPAEIFQRATNSASTRANALFATLRLPTGPFEIGVDVRIHIRGVKEEPGITGMSPVTRMALAWEARHGAGFFPSMEAQLSIWPLSASETQLEVEGEYRPPLGLLGSAADALVGHKIADAVVHRLLGDLVEQLRRDAPPA